MNAGTRGTTRVLIGYATAAGSTRGIAERIAAGLREAADEVVLRPLDPELDVTDYDAFVLGSAVHNRYWLPVASQFLSAARSTLAERPLWVFSVAGLHPHGPVRRAVLRRELAEIDRRFPPGVTPREHRAFGGIVVMRGLPLWSRLVWLAMGARPGDHRDWPAIDRWAARIAATLPSRSPTTPAG